MNKIPSSELSVSRLGRENDNRMTEIAKVEKKLGFQSKIETNNEESEYTSDKDDKDDTSEIKQATNARRLIEEKECTKRCLLNLPSEIELQVKAQKPINLSEA